MQHLSSTPTWTPSGLFVLDTQALNTIGFVLIGLIALSGVWFAIVTRKQEMTKTAIAPAAIFAVAFLTLIGGAITMVTVDMSVASAHRAEIAHWLQVEYGATAVVKDLDGTGSQTVYETAVTIDGKTRIVKLARTADGHVAALDGDAKPLTRKH